MDNKTSLQKSHSKWSNFKLTTLCFLITLMVAIIWIILAFKNYLIWYSFYGLLIIAGFILLCLLALITTFKR